MKEAENYKKRKWYNGHKFPLIPVLTTKKADEQNTTSFSFSWMFFKIWSRDSFDFEISLVFDPSHWGIGVTALIPYLRLVVTIPTTEKMAIWWQTNMWRKPRID